MCLAVPMKIQEIDSEGGLAEYDNVRRRVNLSLVENLAVGDYVIVHVGFALSRLDAEEAARTLELLKEMGALEESEVRSPESEAP